MRDLARILSAYAEVDRLLEESRQTMVAESVVRIEERQVLNDQAYFVLCWGQLENEINARCREAIRLRRSSLDWQVRRGWDLYNPDDARLSGLSFESRTAILLDRAAGSRSPYARVMTHYETRNRVAHGKLEATRINVPAAAQDFYLIQAALHRSA